MSSTTVPKDTIDRMMSTALSGDLNTAIAVLNQSGLNEDQKAKIASILKQPRSDMQQRIIAVVGEDNIAPAAPAPSATQSLLTSQPIANELYADIVGNLFNFLSQGDLTTLSSLACVNKHWSNCSKNFWTNLDLKQLCPELTILDAQAQGVICEDEPKIGKRQLLEWVLEISPQVEGNAGVTLLTMTKGTTLNQLIEIAKGEGLTVDVAWNGLIRVLGDVPVEQTYAILITNSVFLNSRNKDFNSQRILAEGHGCVMPTVQEYVALCVFTNKLFKKCLYEKDTKTFGRSSTMIQGFPLLVGGCVPERLTVSGNGSVNFAFVNFGAGGQRKVGSLDHEPLTFSSFTASFIHRLKNLFS